MSCWWQQGTHPIRIVNDSLMLRDNNTALVDNTIYKQDGLFMGARFVNNVAGDVRGAFKCLWRVFLYVAYLPPRGHCQLCVSFDDKLTPENPIQPQWAVIFVTKHCTSYRRTWHTLITMLTFLRDRVSLTNKRGLPPIHLRTRRTAAIFPVDPTVRTLYHHRPCDHSRWECLCHIFISTTYDLVLIT